MTFKYTDRLRSLRAYLNQRAPRDQVVATQIALVSLIETLIREFETRNETQPKNRWTAKQKDILRKMKRAGKSAEQIAARVGRPRKAVEGMIARMRQLGEL